MESALRFACERIDVHLGRWSEGIRLRRVEFAVPAYLWGLLAHELPAVAAHVNHARRFDCQPGCLLLEAFTIGPTADPESLLVTLYLKESWMPWRERLWRAAPLTPLLAALVINSPKWDDLYPPGDLPEVTFPAPAQPGPAG